MREHLRPGIEVAAQNVFDRGNGAFTGEISAEQLRDSGVGWTLVGHSERRTVLGEGDEVCEMRERDLGGDLWETHPGGRGMGSMDGLDKGEGW